MQLIEDLVGHSWEIGRGNVDVFAGVSFSTSAGAKHPRKCTALHGCSRASTRNDDPGDGEGACSAGDPSPPQRDDPPRHVESKMLVSRSSKLFVRSIRARVESLTGAISATAESTQRPSSSIISVSFDALTTLTCRHLPAALQGGKIPRLLQDVRAAAYRLGPLKVGFAASRAGGRRCLLRASAAWYLTQNRVVMRAPSCESLGTMENGRMLRTQSVRGTPPRFESHRWGGNGASWPNVDLDLNAIVSDCFRVGEPQSQSFDPVGEKSPASPKNCREHHES